MQLLEVSGAVRPIYGSLGVKRLKSFFFLSQLDCDTVQYNKVFLLKSSYDFYLHRCTVRFVESFNQHAS